MNKDRLIELRKLLQDIPEKQFNMDEWIQSNTCGTVACALGWAAMHPPFNEQGLRIKINISASIPEYIDSEQQIWLGYHAAEEFFDITPGIAFWLFCSNSYNLRKSLDIRPTDVVKRINDLIKEEPQ